MKRIDQTADTQKLSMGTRARKRQRVSDKQKARFRKGSGLFFYL